MKWLEDPRVPAFVAALLGMVAGVAAKQAVALQRGVVPKRLELISDVLILGMILVIVMYVRTYRPDMPAEAVALLSGALAMWGPRGIGALVARIRMGMTGSLTALGHAIVDPPKAVESIEPVHRPTMVDQDGMILNPDPGLGEQGKHTTHMPDENTRGKSAPLAKLRDKVPLITDLPADQLDLIAKADQVDPQRKDKRHG